MSSALVSSDLARDLDKTRHYDDDADDDDDDDTDDDDTLSWWGRAQSSHLAGWGPGLDAFRISQPRGLGCDWEGPIHR